MRVVVVGLPRDALRVLEAAGEVTPSGPLAQELGRIAPGHDAAVVLVGGPEHVEAVEVLSGLGLPVVAAVPSGDLQLARSVVRAGARDVVFSDSPEELLQAVRSARPAAVATSSSFGPGAVVAVISPQGGVGRSTVALNLALILGERRSVIAVDLVPYFGILHVLCDLEPASTLADVLGRRGGREAAARALVPYENIRLLAAPQSPEGFRAEPQDVDELLDVLSRMGDCVVVDSERLLLPYVLPVVERAAVVLCLTRMTVPSLRNLRAYMQWFLRQHVPAQKVMVVGVMDRGGISPRQVEEIVGVEVAHVLPYDPVAVAAENQGVPVVLGAPRSRLSRSLYALAEAVEERIAAPQEPLAAAEAGRR